MSGRSDHDALSSPLLSSPSQSRGSTPPNSPTLQRRQSSGQRMPDVGSQQQGTRSRSGSLSQDMGLQVGVQQSEVSRSRSGSLSGGVSPHSSQGPLSAQVPTGQSVQPSTELSRLITRPRAQTSPSGSTATTATRVLGHATDFGAALSSMPVQGSVGPVQGVISGGLWATSALSNVVADARTDNGGGVTSGVFGLFAGGASAAGSALGSSVLLYASNASWLISGGISGAQGAYNAFTSGRNRGANALQAVSGGLNMVGAMAGGASTYFSAQASAQGPQDQDQTNAHLATTMAWVSMGSWALGSLAGMGSTYLSGRNGGTEPESGGGSEV